MKLVVFRSGNTVGRKSSIWLISVILWILSPTFSGGVLPEDRHVPTEKPRSISEFQGLDSTSISNLIVGFSDLSC